MEPFPDTFAVVANLLLMFERAWSTNCALAVSVPTLQRPPPNEPGLINAAHANCKRCGKVSADRCDNTSPTLRHFRHTLGGLACCHTATTAFIAVVQRKISCKRKGLQGLGAQTLRCMALHPCKQFSIATR